MVFPSCIRSVFVSQLCMAVAAEPALALRATLDGKNFDGIVLERGKTSGDADTLIFKDGRFRSTACDQFGYEDGPNTSTTSGENVGNVLVNPAVALPFIDFERPNRLRINGSGAIVKDDRLLASVTGAQFVVRARTVRIFPNCPRHIYRMAVARDFPCVPRAGYVPPVPKWKRFDEFH
jgi:hypothetical protein